ncbi:MAG: MerR family transcriptional regulator [Deltaproteobacteria bacterium]|nr:MerR family transcriptional regulator [Deltaproteobacteria bacterium]
MSIRPAVAAENELVKMSTLARRSGVPAATIKHYLREGLLPQPDVRTSKNMALYDARLVTRVKAIKELQRTRFLPLKVIKGVLDGIQPDTDAETAKVIRQVLDDMTPMEARTRRQLLDAGVPPEELDFFRGLGLLQPEGPHGPLGNDVVDADHEVYVGDDLQLLRVLGEARKAGITQEMLPPGILEPYARAIRELVRTELRLFREGVIPLAGGNLKSLVETATRLSEQLVIVLRRKLLLPTLQQLAERDASQPANDAAAPEPTPKTTPATPKPKGKTTERTRKKAAPRGGRRSR